MPQAVANQTFPTLSDRRGTARIAVSAAVVLLLAVAAAPLSRGRLVRRDTGIGAAAWGLGAALVATDILGQGPLVLLPALLP